MVETIINMLASIFITSAIAFYLGFLFGKSKVSRSRTKVNPIFRVQGNIYNKPLIMGVPRPKGKDDLQEIDGIDATLEYELNELGIYHYDQISKWSSKNSEWIEVFLNIHGQVSSDNWISQASSLSSIKKG